MVFNYNSTVLSINTNNVFILLLIAVLKFLDDLICVGYVHNSYENFWKFQACVRIACIFIACVFTTEVF